MTGFADAGAEKMFGSKFKDMGSFVSWAQLVAASGLVGITYANREPGDVNELLHDVQQNAASLGIDGNRIGVWACSGHGPNALSVLMEPGRDGLRCAVLAYPYTLDLEGPPASPMRRNNFASSLLPPANRCMISGTILRCWL